MLELHLHSSIRLHRVVQRDNFIFYINTSNNFYGPSLKYEPGQRLAVGWTTEGSEFEYWWDQEFALLHDVQTGSEVHPTSYPMGTGGLFPRG
jgi:hypothetical protein